MALEIEINPKKKEIFSSQPQTVSSLVSGHYGQMQRGTIFLSPTEALYLIDIRNAQCTDASKNTYSFNEVAKIFAEKKQMARYFTYAGWRDRGLVARHPDEARKAGKSTAAKKYPSSKFDKFNFPMQATFYPDDLMCIMDGEKEARQIYEGGWFGQFGAYKAEKRGCLGKLDIYEALFLSKHSSLTLQNSTPKKAQAAALKRHPYFNQLYEVYEDWRLNGFILKTGFKFGTHFRIYFPGATPLKEKGWVHSQHVLQVFPKNCSLIISEWARAIRVAHSVRKTFVLAINGQKKSARSLPKKELTLDFFLYHRHGQDIITPKTGEPKFLLLSLSEEEYLSGEQLANAIEECKHAGLELMLGIADRESSVTYYAVKRIDIPGSQYEYYEIEWVQP